MQAFQTHHLESFSDDAETKQLVHDVLAGAVAQLDGISAANPMQPNDADFDDDGANMRFRGGVVIRPSENLFTTTGVSKGKAPHGATTSAKKVSIFPTLT